MSKKQTIQATSTSSIDAAGLALGLIPPQVVSYEETVLGSVLCGFVDFNDVVQILSSEMFYRQANGKIFAAFEKLYGNGEPIDAGTVTNELIGTNELKDAGGEAYIAELTNKGVSARIDYYSFSIFECYLRRELITTCSEVQKSSFDVTADFGEVITQAEKRLNDIILQIAGKKDIEHISTIANVAVDDAFKRIQNARNNKFTGVDTGLSKLNRITCGWQPSKLYILAARPSVGKTSVMLHLARAAAKDDKKVLIFSLEMSGVELVNKLLLAESEIDVDRFKSGYMTGEEELMINSAFGRVGSLPVWIDTTADITMNEIHARAKAMQKKGKCDIVLIDYLGLCREKAHAGRTREQAVSAMSREAKIMAKGLQLPVILLSQLSREVEKRGDKQPQLSDLRDCLPVDEWVDTPCGVVRLKSKPERIISIDACGCKISECNYIEKRYSNTYTVKTRFGSFSATAKHRVLTATGWKYVCELDAERDILASPKIIPHENRGYIPHGRLLGWLIGNGYLSGTPSLCLRNEFLEELCEEVKSFGVCVNPRKQQKCDNATEMYLSNGVESGCKPNPVMEWLRELHLEGKTAKYKSIPRQYLGTSDEAHVELLRGLWEADGTVSKGVARYSTVSEILARQVKWLLHTAGVRSSILFEARKNSNCSDLFTVACVIEDNLSMQRICNNPKRFGALKMPSDIYIDPAPEIFVRLAEEYGADGRIQKKADGRVKSIAKKRLLKMIEDNPISTIMESPFVQLQNMGWTKITSISHNEKEVHVCDLHVPETNCFLTNGIVVHNSGGIEQDADVVMFIWRPDENYLKTHPELEGCGKIIIRKNRDGACGSTPFRHNKEMTKIYDY